MAGVDLEGRLLACPALPPVPRHAEFEVKQVVNLEIVDKQGVNTCNWLCQGGVWVRRCF